VPLRLIVKVPVSGSLLEMVRVPVGLTAELLGGSNVTSHSVSELAATGPAGAVERVKPVPATTVLDSVMEAPPAKVFWMVKVLTTLAVLRISTPPKSV
jgi:hypothetical protein